MGYETHFYGKLEFTRELTCEELSTLDKIINAALQDSDEIFEAVNLQAEATRAIERDGKGALVIDPHDGANLRAVFQNLITSEDLSPHDAASLRISDDRTGLVYCSEKTYDMIGGVNFIIANGRAKIPGFGLKGSLYASTEFEPYDWLVKINEEGWAYQEKCDRHALWDHDKKAYLEWLQLQLSWRRRDLERKDDPRRMYRILADAICDRIDHTLDRYSKELRWNWYLFRSRLRRNLHL